MAYYSKITNNPETVSFLIHHIFLAIKIIHNVYYLSLNDKMTRRREDIDGLKRRGDSVSPRLHDVLLENAELRQEVAKLRRALRAEIKKSNSDPLTGLFNRAGMQSALSSMNANHGVVMAIDMRHLKIINDTYGHKAGDMAITSFTHALNKTLREDDIVARTGGDEFVVIMPGLLPQETSERRYIIKDQLQSVQFEYEGTQLSVGARFGVAKFSPDFSIGDAIKLADEREGKIRDNLRKFDPPRYG